MFIKINKMLSHKNGFVKTKSGFFKYKDKMGQKLEVSNYIDSESVEIQERQGVS